MNDLRARLVDMEMRLAHHERMAEDLSAIVADQAAAIDRLTRRLDHLTQRTREIEAGWERSPQDDKPPPHY